VDQKWYEPTNETDRRKFLQFLGRFSLVSSQVSIPAPGSPSPLWTELISGRFEFLPDGTRIKHEGVTGAPNVPTDEDLSALRALIAKAHRG
jgi:hypothetical protein